jgi:hypothetical protein
MSLFATAKGSEDSGEDEDEDGGGGGGTAPTAGDALVPGTGNTPHTAQSTCVLPPSVIAAWCAAVCVSVIVVAEWIVPSVSRATNTFFADTAPNFVARWTVG